MKSSNQRIDDAQDAHGTFVREKRARQRKPRDRERRADRQRPSHDGRDERRHVQRDEQADDRDGLLDPDDCKLEDGDLRVELRPQRDRAAGRCLGGIASNRHWNIVPGSPCRPRFSYTGSRMRAVTVPEGR